jgi:hypothetical protein
VLAATARRTIDTPDATLREERFPMTADDDLDFPFREVVAVVPGIGVGELRFRMSQEAIISLLGSEHSRHDYGDGRVRLDYGSDLDVLFKEGLGLVAVHVDHGPVLLWGRDVFAMSAEELCEWFAQQGLATTRQTHSWGDVVIGAPAAGLFFYYAEDEPRLQSIEVFLGT